MPDAPVSITIVGLDELQRKLKASPQNTAWALRAGLMTGAEIVKTDAKRRVPKVTRKLNDAIQIGRVTGKGLDQEVRVGIAPGGARGGASGQAYRGRSGAAGYATNPTGRSNTSDPRVYGPYVEEGTRKHEIRPKKAGGVLVFSQAVAGPLKPMTRGKNKGKSKVGVMTDTVFTRHVSHPGTRPQPFLRPALTENISRIQRAVLGQVELMLTKVARR